MSSGPRVVVVGGGIAGLTAAFRLERAGCDVVALERSGPDSVGGRMATIEHDGFCIDVGATLLLSTYTAMLRLAADVGVADQIRPAGNVFGFVRDGHVQHLRSSPRLAALTSRYVRSLPPVDLIKVAIDYLRTRPTLGWDDMTSTAGQDFESVRDYALRRGLRPQTYEYLLAPWTVPALAEPDEASLVSAFFSFNAIIGSGGGFASPQGVGFLPKALAQQVSVIYGAEVTSIETHGRQAVVTWSRPQETEHTETADALVLAVPPPTAADLCAQLPPVLHDYFCDITYSRSVHVAFGLDRPTPEPSLLLQVPAVEHPDVAAYVLEHNQCPDRVPPGMGLVMAHLRGTWSADNWDLDESKVVEHVLAATRRLGILPELETRCQFAEVLRVAPCTVIRHPGEYREVRRIAPLLRTQQPIFFAGADYLGQSSTNGSVVSGERVATEILTALR